MLVASIAPTSKKAARPANQWQASQAAAATSTSTSAPTMASPRGRCPQMRHTASYNSQNATRKPNATATASAGGQSMRDLSIR
jgi:hypothetical protein